MRADPQRVYRALVDGLVGRLALVQRLWAYERTIGVPLKV